LFFNDVGGETQDLTHAGQVLTTQLCKNLDIAVQPPVVTWEVGTALAKIYEHRKR
jgi:hypothetical protein